jgi:hypothetical protein
MYAPQEQFPLYLPGAGVIAGRFSAFSGSSWNRRAMEYIAFFFFWLALSLLCRKKKTGYFFPFFFLSLSFFVLGENSTTIASERYTIFFFESLLTTLMLFNCFSCGCRYGNNENNVLIGGFSTGSTWCM